MVDGREEEGGDGVVDERWEGIIGYDEEEREREETTEKDKEKVKKE